MKKNQVLEGKLTIWGNADSVIHMDFLELGTPVNSECCTAIFKILKQLLSRIWRHLLQLDDARPHTS